MTITTILQLLSILVGAAGAIFGFVRHKQAQTVKAEADSRVALVEKNEAEANAQAAATGAAALAERLQVETATAAKSTEEVQDELDKWRR